MGYYSAGLRGDYYKGDPGFLSTLGGLIKGVGSFIPGVGGLVSGAGGMLEKLGTKAAPAVAATAAITPPGFYKGASQAVARVGTKALGVARAHPVLTAAGAAGIAGAAAGAGGMALKAHLAAGGARRHRRMRVTNPKALRRAIRRTQGFAKLAMKTIHLIHPRKKVRFGGFRRRKRARA